MRVTRYRYQGCSNNIIGDGRILSFRPPGSLHAHCTHVPHGDYHKTSPEHQSRILFIFLLHAGCLATKIVLFPTRTHLAPTVELHSGSLWQCSNTKYLMWPHLQLCGRADISRIIGSHTRENVCAGSSSYGSHPAIMMFHTVQHIPRSGICLP